MYEKALVQTLLFHSHWGASGSDRMRHRRLARSSGLRSLSHGWARHPHKFGRTPRLPASVQWCNQQALPGFIYLACVAWVDRSALVAAARVASASVGAVAPAAPELMRRGDHANHTHTLQSTSPSTHSIQTATGVAAAEQSEAVDRDARPRRRPQPQQPSSSPPTCS